MSQQTMFECIPAEPVWPDWFYAGKNTPACHKQNVMRGLHPMGRKLNIVEGRTCGNCANKFTSVWSTKMSFIKCRIAKNTHGPATDIRAKWKACDKWEPRDETEQDE